MERLVTWLWQGMVLAVGVWGLLRLWRPNAATRFAIWWTTLLAIALLLVTAPSSTSPARSLADASVSAASSVASSAGMPSLLPVTLPAVPAAFVALGIGAWLGFAMLGLVHLFVSVGHLRRIKRACRPFPSSRERRLTRWLMVRGTGRRARLCVSDDVRSASALGLGLGPAIIAINSSLLADVDDEELDHIILHEYAHIRRRDDWLHALQLLLQAVLVLHPAVSWIGRALRLEREAACDEWVVDRTRMPTAYAHCLTKIAAFELAGPNDLVTAMGIVGRRGELTRRIERLLAPDRARHTRLAALPVASVGVMLIAATVGLWQLPPLVATAEQADLVSLATTAIAGVDADATRPGVTAAPSVDALTMSSAIVVMREQPRAAAIGVSDTRRVDVTSREHPTIELASFDVPPARAAEPTSTSAARSEGAMHSVDAIESSPMTASTPSPRADAESRAHAHVAGVGAVAANAAAAEATHEEAAALLAAAAPVPAAAGSADGVDAEADADLDGVVSTTRGIWRRVANAGATVGQRTADVSQSAAKNLASRPSVRGTMTAGAAVGQAGVAVGQGAKRAGTATGSFFSRVGSAIYKALP